MRRTSRGIIVFLALIASTSVLYGQDLSTYRTFKLGMTLADVSHKLDMAPSAATVICQEPALVQELNWWPTPVTDELAAKEAVQQITFSFYDGVLYRITVSYDSSATAGLTTADMIEVLSSEFGTSAVPVARINFPTNSTLNGSSERVLARWEDTEHSSNLFKSPLLGAFGLAIFTKQLDTQAAAAIARSAVLQRQAAPQTEAARLKKEAADLETTRQKNKKAFRP